MGDFMLKTADNERKNTIVGLFSPQIVKTADTKTANDEKPLVCLKRNLYGLAV